ncbi:MAG: DUF4230 domain-containing protein [Oscillospiraceae bacterium]|nr:DUF4230 domain-containing protein [Oscillospiraceae bacterium]
MKLNTRSKSGEASEEQAEKRKRGPSRVKVFLFALLLGAALAFVAVGYLDAMQISAPAITSSLLKEELKYVKDLVTVEYRYTNADKAEFPGHVLFGQNIPFTGKSFIVSYDGVIKYGVDLSAVEIRVNDATRTVTVTVPQSKIISHEMPEASFKALDEKNGLFNRIHIDDVTEFRQAQKSAMEAKASELGLPRQAQEQSGAAIEALLRATPGMEEYDLKIQYK